MPGPEQQVEPGAWPEALGQAFSDISFAMNEDPHAIENYDKLLGNQRDSRALNPERSWSLDYQTGFQIQVTDRRAETHHVSADPHPTSLGL